MSSHITKHKIFMKCEDRYGVTHNLHATAWSKITGKNPASIRRHWNQMKSGERQLTMKQVVGFVEVSYQLVKKEKAIVNDGTMLSKFLRTKLVA